MSAIVISFPRRNPRAFIAAQLSPSLTPLQKAVLIAAMMGGGAALGLGWISAVSSMHHVMSGALAHPAVRF